MVKISIGGVPIGSRARRRPDDWNIHAFSRRPWRSCSLLRPIKDNPLGVFDLAKTGSFWPVRSAPWTLWDDTYIAERDDGDLQIFALGPGH